MASLIFLYFSFRNRKSPVFNGISFVERNFYMGKRRKILTKEEIEKIAEYQLASIKDIMDIGAIGRKKQEKY